MTFSNSTYSYLNNYKYQNKSSSASFLDTLSAPCRKVFGGRDVNILANIYDVPPSTAKRVAIAFFSILIFPVAIISIGALLLKKILFCKEIKEINKENDQINAALNIFENAVKNNNAIGALSVLIDKPALIFRNNIDEGFCTLINKEITKDNCWEVLKEFIPLVKREKAVGLLNSSIKFKLELEKNKNSFFWEANYIESFVETSLEGDTKHIEICYKNILLDSLQFENEDDLFFKLYKMVLSHQIFNHLKEIRKKNVQQGKKNFLSEFEVSNLKSNFKNKNSNFVFYLASLNYINMENIAQCFEDIRCINIIDKSLDIFNALELSENYTSNKQKNLKNEFLIFKNSLQHLVKTAEESEKEHFDLWQNLYEYFFLPIENKLNITLTGQIELLSTNYFNEVSDSNFSKINLLPLDRVENLIANLKLKKTGMILTLTEKMKKLNISGSFYDHFTGSKAS